MLDNALEGRGPAEVRVTVTLLFPSPHPQARVLPTGRRAAVIVVTVLFVFVVVFCAGRRLKDAFRRRPGQPPPAT